MKNLLKKIKGLLVVEEEKVSFDKYVDSRLEANSQIKNKLTDAEEGVDVIEDALAHYCSICKRAWETKIGAKAHKRLKHEGGKSNLPSLKKDNEHLQNDAQAIDEVRNDLPINNPDLTSPQ